MVHCTTPCAFHTRCTAEIPRAVRVAQVKEACGQGTEPFIGTFLLEGLALLGCVFL